MSGKEPDFMVEIREAERQKKISKQLFDELKQRQVSSTLYLHSLERAKTIDKNDIEQLKKKLMAGKR
jgi:hypothetical protein